MNVSVIAKAAVQLLLIAATAAPGEGQSIEAPLPVGVTESREMKVRGVYAEARFGSVVVNDELEKLESACSARGKKVVVEGREFQWSGTRQLYRSIDFIAEFEAMPTMVSDAETCTADIKLSRKVKVVKASAYNLASSGWNLKIPPCSRSHRSLVNRCTTEVVAGVAARCITMGDSFVGVTTCYSTRNDLSRGLMVSGSNYTDDGSGPNNAWGFDRVIPNALIDPAIFRAQ